MQRKGWNAAVEERKKLAPAHIALLALTAAFLGSLAWLTLRGAPAKAPEGYSVAVENDVPVEALAPVVEPVNVNTATAEELERLVGVGPVLAREIVAYRAEHGAFASIDELLNVSGIGEGKLDKIRNDITL